MPPPESSSAYLERCSRACLDALAEARELALAGDAGVADILHYAKDLLDLIADGLNGPQTDSAAVDALEVLREMLSTLRAELAPREPLH